ncbi:MAG: hypothetical protein KDA96_09395 [Planctomycetaceae bacterium]|nr:hypothetical protein [Planctomycetaceae bacterium]
MSCDAVWVVCFDELSTTDATKMAGGGDAEPADGLHSLLGRSTWFERCLTTTTCDDEGWHAPFGTAASFSHLLQHRRSAFICVGEANEQGGRYSDDVERLFSETQCVADDQIAVDDHILSDATFIWWRIPASAGSDSKTNLSHILARILKLKDDPCRRHTPISVIVTARRGGSQIPQPPFQPGIAADRIHVPLWIDTGEVFSCRTQQLCSTNDLLLTARALLGEDLQNPVPESGPVDAPLNLVPFLRQPESQIPRRIRLRTDSERAVYSEDFLATQSIPSDSDVPCELQLYVQPDDYWCIHDIATVDPEVAAELGRFLNQ